MLDDELGEAELERIAVFFALAHETFNRESLKLVEIPVRLEIIIIFASDGAAEIMRHDRIGAIKADAVEPDHGAIHIILGRDAFQSETVKQHFTVGIEAKRVKDHALDLDHVRAAIAFIMPFGTSAVTTGRSGVPS